MLRNGLKTLLILQITFITQNVELSVGVDTNEEHQNFEKVPVNLRNADNEQNNEIGGANDKIDKVEGSEEELNKNAEDSDDSPMKLANSNEYSKNIHDPVKILKEKKPITPPSWNFKDVPTIKEEPGFDLTPEEMSKFKIWKDGVIPYYIDVVSFSDNVMRAKIRHFLYMVNSATNVQFIELPRPPTDEHERWVFFMNRRGLLGCADHSVKNFTNQGVQQVVLGYNCIATKGELAEAVMAIVGVPAQHNAPDRDNYITVNMDNIMPDKRYLFEKLRDDEWLFHDLEYDFESITHYDIHKYSANGRVTIDLKEKTFTDLEPAKALSYTDLLKIKMLYNYITSNAKLQTQVCKKLFKSSSKLKGFISSHKKIKPRIKPRGKPRIKPRGKPRKKPSRYNEDHNDEKQEQIDDGQNEQDEKRNDEDDSSNGNRDKHSQHNEEERRHEEEGNNEDKNFDKDEVNNLQSNTDQPDENQNETGHRHKTKLKMKKNDPLVFLSDYASSDN